MQDSAECHVFPVFWLNQNRLEIYLSLDFVTFSNLKDLPHPDVIVVIVPVAQIWSYQSVLELLEEHCLLNLLIFRIHNMLLIAYEYYSN